MTATVTFPDGTTATRVGATRWEFAVCYHYEGDAYGAAGWYVSRWCKTQKSAEAFKGDWDNMVVISTEISETGLGDR